MSIRSAAVLALILLSTAPALAVCTDADVDGFSPDGAGCGLLDCNDANAGVHPGAPERCNAADDDCDLQVDEEPDASSSCATACTATATCAAGSCVTTPVVCDDANPCTSDACLPASGCQFTAQPNGLSCSDGNVCSGEEICQGGNCTNPPDLDCDDDNACTTDTCGPPNGCRNAPIAGCCTTDADCADGSACTVAERCDGGLCVSDAVDCDDGNPCTSDSCSPSLGCRNIAVVNGIACGDTNVCNGIETCQSGACTPGTAPTCNDGSPCTNDGCDPTAGCTVEQIPGCCATDADCADVSACTTNERCVGNACLSDPLACDDGNACTTDGCAAATGCTFTPLPNGQSCGNLDFCDGFETCQAGTCASGTAPLCDDGNPCTADACNSSTGCTHAAVSGCCFVDADCVDGDQCTIDERCVGGACTSQTRNCNDANPCTQDGCVPTSGCVNIPLIDGTSCADAQACDGIETCSGGTCQPGSPPDCNDGNACTNDVCNNVTGCQHPAVAGCCNADADCADTDLCTTNERCLVSHVCSSTPRTCADGNACTTDGCTPSTGCVFTPSPGGCDDGQACTADDTCNAGTCAGAPIQCVDGDYCDGAEACSAGTCVEGTMPACTPGGRNFTRTCLAEWYVDNPTNPGGPLARMERCAEGDPSCDHDDDPDVCTFRVSVCLRVADVRMPGCLAGNVDSYVLPRSLLKKNQPIAAALMSALNSLPGATVGGRFSNEVHFAPALQGTACTGLVDVPVPVRRRFTLKGNATGAAGQRDKDKLKLACDA
jgi:hypothetical protein